MTLRSYRFTASAKLEINLLKLFLIFESYFYTLRRIIKMDAPLIEYKFLKV